MSSAHNRVARIDNLTIHFPGRTAPAVDGVSLTIRSGECIALVGESGSGKSLTARAMLGLLPPEAQVQYERVELLTEAVPRPGARAWYAIRGRNASLVPQDALGSLDPLRRVEHEVGDTLRLHRIASGRERRLRILDALRAASMPDPEYYVRRRSDELSGGLRQRALVASALIAHPQLIIADEPTTALDAGHRGRVLAELRRRVEAGAGVLLISHDLTSVRDIADHVLVMRDGKVIEQGEPSVVLSAPVQPFTRELLAAAPAGRPRGTRLIAASKATPPRTPAPTLDTPDVPVREPRLELQEISVSFGHPKRQILSGASLNVYPGETVGLVGQSGSGKTTLIRVALGLQAPDSGDVMIDGVSRSVVSRRKRRELRRRIALVPQDPLDSFPRGISGVRLLADALRAAGVPRTERNGKAVSLAEEVKLSADDLDRPVSTLSGGQRQRLAIARALARDPELLLLDEPVSALDITVQARVLDLLDDVQAHRGTAYLLVSHDEDVIRHMSDRMLRLHSGKIEAAR